jgi:predicted GNAT family N-acyltransferase
MKNGLNLKRQKCEKNKTIQNILDMNAVCKLLEYGSPEQKESIELRDEVLRKPLGLKFSEEELKEDEQFHFACFIDNKIKGILLLKPIADGIIKMRQVAVSPELHGKGIGKQLVKFCEQWAIDNGYHKIELNARKTAMDFYLSLDYKTIGDEFTEVNIPHMKMYKVLNGW